MKASDGPELLSITSKPKRKLSGLKIQGAGFPRKTLYLPRLKLVRGQGRRRRRTGGALGFLAASVTVQYYWGYWARGGKTLCNHWY